MMSFIMSSSSSSESCPAPFDVFSLTSLSLSTSLLPPPSESWVAIQYTFKPLDKSGADYRAIFEPTV